MREMHRAAVSADTSGTFYSDPWSPVNSIIGVSCLYGGDATTVDITLQGGFADTELLRDTEADAWVDLGYTITGVAVNTVAALATTDGDPTMFAAWPRLRFKVVTDDAAEVEILAMVL